MDDGISSDAWLNIFRIIGASIPFAISYLHLDCYSLVDERNQVFFCYVWFAKLDEVVLYGAAQVQFTRIQRCLCIAKKTRVSNSVLSSEKPFLSAQTPAPEPLTTRFRKTKAEGLRHHFKRYQSLFVVRQLRGSRKSWKIMFNSQLLTLSLTQTITIKKTHSHLLKKVSEKPLEAKTGGRELPPKIVKITLGSKWSNSKTFIPLTRSNHLKLQIKTPQKGICDWILSMTRNRVTPCSNMKMSCLNQTSLLRG